MVAFIIMSIDVIWGPEQPSIGIKSYREQTMSKWITYVEIEQLNTNA